MKFVAALVKILNFPSPLNPTTNEFGTMWFAVKFRFDAFGCEASLGKSVMKPPAEMELTTVALPSTDFALAGMTRPSQLICACNVETLPAPSGVLEEMQLTNGSGRVSSHLAGADSG